MDGTLFTDKLEILPKTLEAIRAWTATGGVFVPATGRPLAAMKRVLKYFPEDMIFILCDGALVIRHISKKVLFSSNLKPNVAERICKMAEEKEIAYGLWYGDALYINKRTKIMDLYVNAVGGEAIILKKDESLKLAKSGKISKISWLDSADKITLYQKELDFGDGILAHASRPELLEFVDSKATKGAALELTARTLDIKPEEIAAFGDYYNDISMFKYAGHSIAMEGAPDEVKAAANEIIGSNNQGAVGDWIINYLKNL